MKNTNYDIITVGAGAAGLAAAISAKRNNRDLKIAILEAQSKAGKKILVTGNGRCNLTNTNVSKEFYHGSFDVSKTLNRIFRRKTYKFLFNLRSCMRHRNKRTCLSSFKTSKCRA
ncbi:MAG: NAD(P)/FAD-dependent oxidoreductase [Ruminococcus sp.]